jgi:hypothetical protein
MRIILAGIAGGIAMFIWGRQKGSGGREPFSTVPVELRWMPPNELLQNVRAGIAALPVLKSLLPARHSSTAFGPEGVTWPRHPSRWSRHP